MDYYVLGQVVGKIIFVLFIFGVFWIFYRLVKAFFSWIFKNPTKELLKTYLSWSDFASTLDVNSMDEFKKALKKVKLKKVYQNIYHDEFKHIYLTKNEAMAISKEFKELMIKEILEDKESLMALAYRIERLTLYEQEDLKYIKRGSKMMWTNIMGVKVHFILKDKKIIYPKDFPVHNQFRFGYAVFRDESGLKGLYDIDADELILDFEYQSIECFGNLAELSKNEETYEIYDLKENKLLQTHKNKVFPNITDELKERIDVSKLELEDYMFLHPTPKSRDDLQKLKLWGAKVGVHQVPSGYEDLLEDPQSGTIEWNHYCSADIFEMSVELPVNFKKKNGDYVSLGIRHEYLVLEKKYRENLKRLSNLKEEKSNNIKFKFGVYLDDNEDQYGNSRYVDGADDLSDCVERFETKEEAVRFIESRIDEVLKEMAQETKNVQELKTMDIPHPVSYFIKEEGKPKEFFKTWQYIQDNAQRVF